jgi:hypothetical protein
MIRPSAEGRTYSVGKSPFRPKKPELPLVLKEASIYVAVFAGNLKRVVVDVDLPVA